MTAVSYRAAGLVCAVMLASCAKSEPPLNPATDTDSNPNSTSTDHGHRSDSNAVDLGTDAAVPDAAPDDMRPPDDMTTTGVAPIRTVAAACPMTAVSGGTAWTGWANLQFPARLELAVGEVSEPVFGQTWAEGQTDQPGMASGWEGQLVVGPLGANPETQPGCFRVLDAAYNVDVGNNDEWWVRLQSDRAGLFGMYTRFRPPNGAWRYGDLNGSDDGVTVAEAGVLAVEDPAGPDEIRVVTLNLRCRIGDWNTRRDLVIRGLAAADPHIIGLQEDCSVPGGPSQASEIVAELAELLDRGFEVRRTVTHQAMPAEGTFDEGISLLSAFPIANDSVVALPFANFPRSAIIADVELGGGETLRVVNTHMEFGGANDDVRDEQATLMLTELGSGPALLMGDLNTEDDEPAYATFAARMTDTWAMLGTGNGSTFPSSSPVRRIDYIWFSGLTADSVELVREVENSVFLSDHLGISATYRR